MLKIHQLFVIKFLVLVVSATLFTSIASYLFLEKNLMESHETRLKNVMEVIAINLDSQSDLDAYLQMVGEKTELNVTLSESARETRDEIFIQRKFVRNSQELYVSVGVSSQTVKKDFYSLWIILGGTLLFVWVVSFVVAKSMAYRVERDIRALREYLIAINSKDYETSVHIRYYKEFLQIAVLMKNLVKRLNAREKKLVKKSGKK